MTVVTYGSVCSGIEAATLAWEPLGWQAAWFAEIEKFPSQVLAHRWPRVTNLGDMTQLPHYIRNGWIPAPDILVGGTPCQAFSVAGLRGGLVDPRGALTIKFVEIANAIDEQRPDDPCVVVWENVPGVLSDKTNAFGCFLAALVGEGVPLEPPGGKWANAGCVLGPQRAAAWRILDAQYFGVAQRRRRVFVVASARAGFDPVEVLFESDGVRRDTAPSREAGQEVAPTIRAGAANGSPGHGQRSGDSRDELIVPELRGYRMTAFGGGSTTGAIDVATTCNAHAGGRMDFESETFVCDSPADPLIAFNCDAQPDQMNFSSSIPSLTCSQRAAVMQAETTHTLRGEGFDASEDGTGRGTPIVACYPINTLTLGGRPDPVNDARMTLGVGADGDPQFTLQAAHSHAVATAAFSAGQTAGAGSIAYQIEQSPTLRGGASGTNQVPALHYGLTVRRLMPVECELLQGMPRNHTLITPNTADGPRYKAIGNSKAVPVVRWLGRRIHRRLR